MIEKGKGDKMNKFRVMQIIEADLQLLMRIFLRLRIEENYEDDKRMSKHNYGSRKFYSIESLLLEKRFFDLAKKTEEVFYALHAA